MRLLPITQSILREAARLRATIKLKTPDAIHAATASAAFVTLPTESVTRTNTVYTPSAVPSKTDVGAVADDVAAPPLTLTE